MTIEVGDTVQTSNKPSRLFGVLLVIEIGGDNEICAYNLLDKDLLGDERSTSYSPTIGIFPISELTMLRKKSIRTKLRKYCTTHGFGKSGALVLG